MRLRAIIADDEPLALRRLQIALRDIGGVEIVGTAKDGVAALELVRSKAPDLILADIKMPGLSGLRLVELMDLQSPPAVVFVTAYDQFAVKAFEEGAIDYVLKPIGHERLRRAIERARQRLRTHSAEQRVTELRGVIASLQRKSDEQEGPAYDDALWIGTRGKVVRVAARDVCWFEAAGDYVAVHTPEQEHMLHDSLSALEARLDPALFVRVHRGAIVRKDAVTAIERLKFGAIQLRLSSGAAVSVSRSYRQAVRSLFKD